MCLSSEVLFAALVRVRSKHLARWYRVYCSFNQRNFQSRSILRYLSGSSYPESSYLHIACNFRLIFTNLSNTCFVRLQIVHWTVTLKLCFSVPQILIKHVARVTFSIAFHASNENRLKALYVQNKKKKPTATESVYMLLKGFLSRVTK